MNDPRPETLLEFLEQEATNFGTLQEVQHTFRKLGPLVLMAEKNRYDLAKNSRRLREQAQRTLTAVTGKNVTSIKTISILKPVKPPPVAILEPNCIIDMRCAVDYKRSDKMEYIFDKHIWKPFGPVVWEGIGKWVWNKVGTFIWRNAYQLNRLAALLYVGFTLAGAHGKMRKLAQWVELMPKAFPIGPLKDRPDCWLIVTR